MNGNERSYHIGCQSWQYEDWITPAGGKPVFYPRGTRSSDMLLHYAQMFDTIEVDSTAYGTPQLSTIEGWLDETPADFFFSLKVPRAVTHEYSLDARSYRVMDEFIDAARSFESRLGVVLIQFPAVFESTKENGKLLRAFLERLPNDVRFAVEFRHPGWFVEWTYEELSSHGVALALVAGKWIPAETMFDAFAKTTAPFAYVRFMGVRDLEKFDRVVRSRREEIGMWVERIRELTAHEIFIYVDNHFEGHAPATANTVLELLGLPTVNPGKLEVQGSLF